MPTFANPAALIGTEGTDLGVTDWTIVTQDQIDAFAEATHDHQWIHTNDARALAGPFGAPIAHGYLTMSLASFFLAQLVAVKGISMGVNYGVDRVRFPAPVRVDSKIRGRGEIRGVTEIDGGVHVVTRVTVELEGSEKPAAIVDTVSRYLTEGT